MVDLLIRAIDADGRKVDSGLLTGSCADDADHFREIWEQEYPDCRIEIEPARG